MVVWLEIDLDDLTTAAFFREPDREALASVLPALAYPGLQPVGRIDGALVTANNGGASNLSVSADNGRGQLTDIATRIPLLSPGRMLELVDGVETTIFSGTLDSQTIGPAVRFDLVA